jgi:dTDP-4-amino-4,6-dideoxygalactose transaminase
MPLLPVPFLDLAASHRALENEMLEAILPILRNAAFVGGDPVARFERAFAEAHGVPHAVTVKSGTAALALGLTALGVKPGDEVIVPAFTFIATAAAVVHAGATPVFADVLAETACLDPGAAARAITPRTKALIPVHLYGHPAAMDELLELAREHGLRVLEDCAQSHLARWRERTTGALGDAGAFSFYPTKNLGAAGDGGAVITSDAEIAGRIRRLANHGRAEHSLHVEIGGNERLDAMQAAILSAKLGHLAEWTELRRRAAARYRELLEGIAPWGEPLRLPLERPGARHVYHLFTVRHSRRDALAALLKEAGIGTAVHYPLAVPAQPAFRDRPEGRGDWPEADAWARTCLSLPLYPGITEAQQARVAEAIRSVPR